ncbi:DUF4091 domain-containing protein, partial [Myxococcota bacterium]|nr:DUF4091 domain-containing protein [Myxococcota bacterium]
RGLGDVPDPALALAGPPLHLRAARDEVLAFQVVLEPRTGSPALPRTVQAGLTSFTYTTGGPAPIRATLHREVAIPVTEPSDTPNIHSLGVAAYPDVLVPTSTITIPPRPALAVLWIDLFVPRTAAAGRATAELVIEGATPIAIEIDILELTLPERDVAGLGAVNFGSLLSLEKRDPARFLAWMQLAHAHHFTIELMRPRPELDPTGVILWQRWAARVGPFVDGSAFSATSSYDGPRADRPITRFVLPLAEHWPSRPRDDGYLPSDAALWSRALAEWEQLARGNGWIGRPGATEWILFINALDEPKTPEKLRALADYRALIDAAKLEDRDHVQFRVDGVLGARIEGWPDARKVSELAGVVDLWNLHGATDTAPLGLLTSPERGERPRRAMFYASSSGGEPAIPPLVVDAPIAGARTWAWLVARYGLAGAMNWEVDVAAGCVERPRCTDAKVLNLDATLIYRGHEVGRATDEPIPSMRLKALRRGAQDVALLELLRAEEPDAAAAIAARVVPKALGDGLPRTGLGTWPRDARSFVTVREEVIDRLLGVMIVEKRPNAALRAALVAIVFGSALAMILAIRHVLRRAPPWAKRT